MLLIVYLDHKTSEVSFEEGSCRRDIKCWGKRNLSKATACTAPIERALDFDFKWTGSTFATKMSKYRWHKQAALTLTFSGDDLLVQNVNGAFVRTMYECDFDPINAQVIAVRVRPGRVGD